MKVFVLAATIAVLGIAGSAMWLSSSPPAGVDPIVSSSFPASSTSYTATNINGNTSCRVERGLPVSHRSRQFIASPECDAVWPGLASAKTWTDNEDGTVILASANGEAVLTIVDGDGPGYETLEPAGAPVMLRTLQ